MIQISFKIRACPKGHCVIDATACEGLPDKKGIVKLAPGNRFLTTQLSWQSNRKTTERDCLHNVPEVLNALFAQWGHIRKP